MATMAGQSTSNHSPRYSTELHSSGPQLVSRVPSSLWSQVARSDSDFSAAGSMEQNVCSYDLADGSCASPSEEDLSGGSDRGNENSNGSGSKKPAWNKPSNEAPVMDADSWPALSESARASSKSSSDSIKSSQDGPPIPSSQVGGSTPVASPSSPAQKQVSSSGKNQLTMNHPLPVRQKSFKRGNGNFSGNNGNGSVATPGVAADATTSAPSRDHTHKGAKWDSSQRGHQSQNSNDHSQQRYRRNNVGSNPRGENSYHANYGGRRDHDWGNQDWHSHRNFNGRNVHLQPRPVPGGFVRPPHNAPPFIAPPFRPFAGPLGFELAAPMLYIHPDSFTGMPFMAPMPRPTMMFPPVDPQLHNKVLTQIEYYFSNENLVKDTFLRQNMDEHGWVSIKLISGFNKVKSLTDDIHLVMEALQASKTVEVQGDRVRRRHDWMRWIMPSVNFPGGSRTSAQDALIPNLGNLSLDPRNASHGRANQSDPGL